MSDRDNNEGMSARKKAILCAGLVGTIVVGCVAGLIAAGGEMYRTAGVKSGSDSVSSLFSDTEPSQADSIYTGEYSANTAAYVSTSTIFSEYESVSASYEPSTVRYDAEDYDDYIESGFVSTQVNPLSTFAADADTASFTNVRRMLRQGYGLDSIPSGSVRVEEWLNYFKWGYDSPDGDDLFSMTAEMSQCPWNQDTVLLTMGFQTPSESAVLDGGRNVVFLIDVSGSMSDRDKIDLLKTTLVNMLDDLDETDRISIVTYASGEEVLVDGATGTDKDEIAAAIKSLEASGSTNGEAGIQRAYEVAERNFIDGGVNRIIMCSDGDLNVGVTSESQLRELVTEKKETGVYLTILGFGTGNYNEPTMETLADCGNGHYKYIDSEFEAKRVIADEMSLDMTPMVDDVKFQVEFNPSQVKGYRLIGYANRALADEDFEDDAVDAGEIGAGHSVTVAYEIVPVGSAMDVAEFDLKYTTVEASESTDWLTVSTRYRDAATGEMRQQEFVVDESFATDEPSDRWRFAAGVIEAAELAYGSRYIGDVDVSAAYDLMGDGIDSDVEASRSFALMLFEMA